MEFENIFSIIAEFKKKLMIIVGVFGIGSLVSFFFMGDLIKKIEIDMFWRMHLQDKPDAGRQLIDISNNLTAMSTQVSTNSPTIAENLTKISGELLNISKDVAVYKPNIVYLSPMEVLMLEFKMSIIIGVLIASPLILFYIYRAARSRLTNIPFIKERKGLIISSIVASIILFLVGAGYAYYFMLPKFLGFLYNDAMRIGINPTFSIYEFISFVLMITVVLGFSFELPVILFFLVNVGVTSRQTLSHYRRHAYIILLIISAAVTPDPTMFSQIMIAVPFIILYEISLVVMRITGK